MGGSTSSSYVWLCSLVVPAGQFGTHRTMRNGDEERSQRGSVMSRPPKMHLSESQKQDLSDLFELFDTDGGGTLDPDEIKIALLTLGFTDSTDEEVNEYVRHLDTEDEGGLNVDQFIMLVTVKASQRNLRRELKGAFDAMTKGERYLKLSDIIEIAREKDIDDEDTDEDLARMW